MNGGDPLTTRGNTTKVSVISMVPAGVQVSWEAVPGAIGYRVDRQCGSEGYTELTTTALPATVTTFSDGFMPNAEVTCVYRIRTVMGNQVSSGTESNPIKPVVVKVPETASVTASLTGNTVLVNWAAVPEAFYYWLDRKCGVQTYQKLNTQHLLPATTSYTDSSPVAGTTCIYRVRVTQGNFTSQGKESNPVEIPASTP